jgi:transmembrane sensor
MNEQEAKSLLEKYNNGTATPEERQQVETYFFRYLKKNNSLPNEERLLLDHATVRNRLLKHISQEGHIVTLPKRRWPRIAVAASIILALSAGGYMIWHNRAVQQVAQNQPHDIAPGSNKAILTLANGQKILLTPQSSGKLAQQGAMSVLVNKAGAVTYSKVAGENVTTETAYNTLTTNRKEQYPIVLADGTKAWLNSASSITYPVAFTGKERKVTITGEVYFEVAHHPGQPFSVQVGNQTIEDIGTEFNINAYGDEPVIKTTLLQGSIRVNKGDHHTVLVPGQQAITQTASQNIKVLKVNTEEAVAWKNGYFFFSDDEDIQTVMRKITRWYDVDIIYPAEGPPQETFGGTAKRYGNVSQVLKELEITGDVKFKIEGRKIYVLKK